MEDWGSPLLARRFRTIANRSTPSQFSLDGLLINGLEVRVLPGSPLFRKDLPHFSSFRFFLHCGDFCGESNAKVDFSSGCRRDAGTRTSSFPTEGKTLPSRLRTVVWPRSFLPGSARRSMSTHLVDPAPRSALRRTGPSRHQAVKAKAHEENDPATPTAGISDRITESSTQPSTSAVIFEPAVVRPINPHVLHTSTPPNTHSTALRCLDTGAPKSSISGANASNREPPKSLTTPTTSRLPTQDAVPSVPTPLLPDAFRSIPSDSPPATAQIHPAILPTISLHFRVSAPIDQTAQTFRSPRTPTPSAPVASNPRVPHGSNGPPRHAHSTYFRLHSSKSKPPANPAKAHSTSQASAPKASHSTPTYVPSQSSLNKKNVRAHNFTPRSGRRTSPMQFCETSSQPWMLEA